jgi:hypothetical protein
MSKQKTAAERETKTTEGEPKPEGKYHGYSPRQIERIEAERGEPQAPDEATAPTNVEEETQREHPKHK